MTLPTPLRDLLAFDRDRLVVADMSDPRVKRLRRARLSASTASNITGCPTRFAIEAVLVQVESPFSDAELGSSGHKVLELLYGHPAPDRTTTTASQILNNIIETHPNDIVFPTDPIEQGVWRSEVAARIGGLWKIENPMEIDVVSTEMAFNAATVGGVPANGFIDRVDHLGTDDDGMRIGIRDYKTGKVKKPYNSNDPHGDQLRIYALAYESIRGRMPTEARVDYVRFGEARVVDLSKKALVKTEKYFVKAWDTISESADAATYETKPSALCPWCPLATVCPGAIEAGRNKKGSRQKQEDFISITEVGERMQLPVITPTSTTVIPLEEHAMSTEETRRPSRLAFSPLTEEQPWNEVSDDSLNPNSYASGAAFGLTEQAVKKLEQAGMEVNGKSVRALSATFASIVEGVQRDMINKHNFNGGSHTRLRGALNQALYTYPVPFGADEAGWADWFEQITKRINAVVNTAFWLWANRNVLGATPFADLVGVEPVDKDSKNTSADTESGAGTTKTPAPAEPKPESKPAKAEPKPEPVTPTAAADPEPEAVIAAEPEAKPGTDEAHENAPDPAEAIGGYDPADDF